MIGYIRDPKTWAAVKTVTVADYELPLETAQGETGKATILGQLDGDYSRYLLSLENMEYIFKITGQQSGDRLQTTLTLADSIGILEGMRVLRYDGPHDFMLPGDICRLVRSWPGIGAFGEPSNNLPSPDTPLPKYTYLNSAPARVFVTAETISRIEAAITARSIPLENCIETVNDAQYFGIPEQLLRALRQYGFSVNISKGMAGTVETLLVDIDDASQAAQVIATGDGHTEVLSEAYTEDICSAVYVALNGIAPVGDADVRYLTASGTVSQNVADQVPGYASTAYIESPSGNVQERDAQIDAAAAEIFAKNTRGHKIEFASDKVLHIGQPVRLMLSRGVLDTVISKVMKKSGDTRYQYTCGELPVTAAEMIRADNITYASRLPNHPRKGQLFILPD